MRGRLSQLAVGHVFTPAYNFMPGIAVAVLLAIIAQLLELRYGAPAMLMALLLGMVCSFLSQRSRLAPGVAYAAKGLLRLGVALLGVRISVQMAVELGYAVIALVVCATIATILFGLLVGPLFGHRYRFSLLSAGSVAICGASAAIAIAAILPQDKQAADRLAFTIIGVTLLSTIAMVLYPLLVAAVDFDEHTAGIFIGASIHDVAQVVGAGFSISEYTGELATLVKLMRVAMLAPVVLVASLLLRYTVATAIGDTKHRPPLLPTFVIGFVLLACINSLGLIPESVGQGVASLSRWMLLIAIVAVGMKTSLKQAAGLGVAAIGLLVVETLFIGGVVFSVLYYWQ